MFFPLKDNGFCNYDKVKDIPLKDSDFYKHGEVKDKMIAKDMMIMIKMVILFIPLKHDKFHNYNKKGHDASEGHNDNDKDGTYSIERQ